MASGWLKLLAAGGLAAASLASTARAQQAGSVDPGFNPGFGINGIVSVLAVQPDGKTLVGGQFDHVNALPYNGLARLNADGSVDTAFVPPAFATASSYTPASINALALQSDGRILVGGAFIQAGGQAHANLARLNTDGTLDASFSPNVSLVSSTYIGRSVNILAMQPDGKIVVGGSFSAVNGQPRRSIARLNADGTLDAGFDPATPANLYPSQGLNGDVYAVALAPDGSVYVAGNFSLINGVSRRALARLRGTDGNLDPGFAPAIGNYPNVSTVACQPDGKVLVAGGFPQTVGSGVARNDLLRFNPDGSDDADFLRRHRNKTGSSSIHSIIVQPQDGAILLAGFIEMDDIGVGPVARYQADGRPDKTFFPGLDPRNNTNGISPDVTALAVRTDSLVVVGGTFETVDGQFRHNLAGLRGKPTADCPVVNATATVPLALIGRNGAPSPQSGKIVVATSAPSATALAVRCVVSGAGVNALDLRGFFLQGPSGILTIKPGAHKTHLSLTPLRYFSLGSGVNSAVADLKVEPGRGYLVGPVNKAEVQVVPQ